MRYIPMFLTLLLMGAWVYTSWYWYTCNIKGFCDDAGVYIEENTKTTNLNTNKDITKNATQIEDIVEKEELSINEKGVIAFTGSDAETLSADDVLSESPKKESSASGSELSLSGALSDSEEKEEVEEKIQTLCQKALVGPIKLGATNDELEVKRLENFLISQGESVTVNGVYGNDDFEAVKRFQLKYKAQILDPWGIKNPTGYVFRTTVKTMNEVSCGKTYTVIEKTNNTEQKPQENQETTETEIIEEKTISDEASL